MHFDDILEKYVGRVGFWHVIFLLVLLMSTNLPLQFFTQFAFITPPYHCRQPALENLSWTPSDIRNLSIPFKLDPMTPPAIGQSFYPCKEYNLDLLWTHLSNGTTLEEALLLRDQLIPNLTSRSCQNGIFFDHTNTSYDGSFGEEFEIVCDRAYFIPLSNTLYFVGMLIGLAVAGPLCDKFGRRLICLVTPGLTILFGLATSAINSLWLFLILRLITGTLACIAFMAAIIMMSEWTTADQRNAFSFVRKIYYGLGARCFLTLAFYVMPNWRSAYAFYFIIAVPFLFGYFIWFESPRWLLYQGRTTEAHTNILKVMRWNREAIYPDDAAEMKRNLELLAENPPSQSPVSYTPDASKRNAVSKKDSRAASFLNDLRYIFSVAKFRRRLLLMLIIWPIQAFIFYGLNFNAVRLGSNPFLIGLFSSLTSLPGNLLQYLVYRFFDRKRPLTILYGLCGLALLASFLLTVVGQRGTPVVIFSTIGLVFSDALFTMLYVRTPELFPTNVRATSVGLCSAVARIGMILAANVERLDEMVWAALPLLIYFSAAAITVVASLFLPFGYGEMEEIETECEEIPIDNIQLISEDEEDN